ncbi:MAG: DUF5103 domain-containing protein [Flavobacteriales bacterium]|nr:DUF5103 domain-containing protein [Flavobacteriales bacterium]
MEVVFKIIVALLLMVYQTVAAQPEWESGQILRDTVCSTKIKTCMLTPPESLIDFPVIAMNSPERLLLQFDDFDFDSRDYMYSISHCNADWSISDLHSSEFIDGFPENYIHEYEFSFNTKLSYVHYELVIPNSDFRFKKSGNYIITVYDSEQPDAPMLTKRFMVYDEQLLVGAQVHQATLAKGRHTDHEIDVIVNFTNVDYVNPIQDVHLVIYQGHRWDNAITNLTPSFVEHKRLVYDFEEESSFEAGNEYRFFDSKSVRFYTERVQKIIHDSVDVVLLFPDHPWGNQAYSFYPDIEGYYVPNIMEKSDARVEADYVWVNFCLQQNPFVDKGDVFVYGALTDWNLKEEAKLTYDERMGCYETSLLLKQGYYNYTYLFVSEESRAPSQEAVDGNFYQTAQDYFVFVYLYDYDYGYDRLLGMRKITTKGMF